MILYASFEAPKTRIEGPQIYTPAFVNASEPLEDGKYLFQDHLNSCRKGTASYEEAGYQLTEDFERDLCNIATEEEDAYHAFFDRYGTVC